MCSYFAVISALPWTMWVESEKMIIHRNWQGPLHNPRMLFNLIILLFEYHPFATQMDGTPTEIFYPADPTNIIVCRSLVTVQSRAVHPSIQKTVVEGG